MIEVARIPSAILLSQNQSMVLSLFSQSPKQSFIQASEAMIAQVLMNQTNVQTMDFPPEIVAPTVTTLEFRE
jgi:hypothetical protein